VIRRHAAGVMSLRRAGQEIAGGAAMIRLMRRQDGVLRLEIADDLADGLLCRAAADVDAGEVERILGDVARGATSAETRAVVTSSVLDVVMTGPGIAAARIDGPAEGGGPGRLVTIRISIGEVVMEAVAGRAELVLALVDLLPVPERDHNPLGRGSSSE